MSSEERYGSLFRRAFEVLHGGQTEEEPVYRQAGETLEEFLARSRREALVPVLQALEGATPPQGMEEVHRLLLQAIRHAIEADAALVSQVRAYGCGDFQASMAHSQRVAELVAEGARLDRRLILALEERERQAPGTLASLGLAGLLPDRPGGHDSEEEE